MLKRVLFLALLTLAFASSCDDESPGCSGCSIGDECIPEGAANAENDCLVCDPDQSRTGWTLLDEAAGECTGNCSGCIISGTCHSPYSPNPENPCLLCDPEQNSSDWSNDDGASCDDGVFCNGADSCSQGICSEHDGDPCMDDGVACNGTESCNEEAGVCESSEDVCMAGETCDTQLDQCCSPQAYLECDENDDVVWVDSCGTRGVRHKDCLDGCEQGSCVCAEGTTGSACERCVIYVNQATGSDGNTGDSWANAFETLQAGLDAGHTGGCEVWVASGVYQPESGTPNDIEASFMPYPNLVVYGGFAGNERSPDLRNIAANATILEGEMGDISDVNDNICHLMTGADNVTIDGLVFRNATASFYCANNQFDSAAINMHNSLGITTFTIRNSHFLNLTSISRGTLFTATDVHLTMEGCQVEQSGPYVLIELNGGSFSVTDTVFSNNTTSYGGLISEVYPDVPCTLSHVTIQENVTERGVIVEEGALLVKYTEIINNIFDYGSAIEVNGQTSMARVDSSSFVGNTISRGGALLLSSLNTSFLNNIVVFGNETDYLGTLLVLSPLTIRNSTIVGNNSLSSDAHSTGGIYHGTGQALTIRNTILWGNTTSNSSKTVAMQQLYEDEALPSLSNSVFECEESSNCLPPEARCDGILDCPFGSDEDRCGSCGPNEWRCGTFACVDIALLCDGVSDCSDNSDEAYCGSCGAGTIPCRKSCGGPSVVNEDPQLTDAALGTTTPDLRPQPSSVCVDNGLSLYLMEDTLDLDLDGNTTEPISLDIDGNSRVQGNNIDIGAYEVQ